MEGIQKQGIIISLALLGLKMGVFDCLQDRRISENELIAELDSDHEYLRRWLLAAEGYSFIVREGETIMLSAIGKQFVVDRRESEVAGLLQAVFSVMLAHEILPYLKTGERPGYGIINNFINISPWYDFVNYSKNRALAEDLVAQPLIRKFLAETDGNVADFSCGNGWFISLVKGNLGSCKLFGVGGHNIPDSDVAAIEQSAFFEGETMYDLVILNKVLHHIWHDNELVDGIVNRLTLEGRLFIWEFEWNPIQRQRQADREVLFLNLVEYMQGSEYIASKDVEGRFQRLGFRSETIRIDEGRQVVYLMRRA